MGRKPPTATSTIFANIFTITMGDILKKKSVPKGKIIYLQASYFRLFRTIRRQYDPARLLWTQTLTIHIF